MNEYITLISISLNAMFLWAWLRRAELLEAAIAVRDAWEDEKITDDEYRIILEKFEAVAAKRS